MKAMRVVAGLACLLMATAASAQVMVVTGDSTQSPRTSMLELKLGSYLPMIDSEPGLTGTPFASTFGAGGILLFELEYNWQFFQDFGSAALGFSAGYGEKFGDAKAVGTGEVAGSTGMRVFPLRLLGVYRFDVLAMKFGVPLVPYGKLGLVGIPWSVVKGSSIETFDGQKGQGFRYGYQGVAGLALQLDFLAPRMARDFDSSLGVNHSYLFGEYTWANVDNFGSPGLNFSGRYLMFGLGLEF
ncbi:MAG: MXAN_2562 family outer membrane beta-barrel protein [Myxococcaceae bacterium]|nr:MXAN_2562 family outer membrane beta-barrel protein [Myxococcaceae bacterium]MCI0671106.1 MXAN_2562 family outer membrane beta-barrel protein [Myxococcaceae bacterium]